MLAALWAYDLWIYHDVPAVLAPDGQHRAADKEGLRVTAGAHPQALHPCALHDPHVQQPAAQGPAAVQALDNGDFTGT